MKKNIQIGAITLSDSISSDEQIANNTISEISGIQATEEKDEDEITESRDMPDNWHLSQGGGRATNQNIKIRNS